MTRSPNYLFARTIDGKPVMISREYVVPSAPPRPKQTSRPNRTSKIVLTALIALIGIGAGWIGGKVLNARFVGAPDVALQSGELSGQLAPAASQPLKSSPPAKHNADLENRSDSRAPRDDQQPVIETEVSSKAVASREAPPKVPRVEKEEELEVAPEEDPSKEIGRSALKKIKKETKKGKKHDPENENEHWK